MFPPRRATKFISQGPAEELWWLSWRCAGGADGWFHYMEANIAGQIPYPEGIKFVGAGPHNMDYNPTRWP